ncbi:hypothetical protein RFI_11541 [Reticulomyxa filosa]|uniref:Kelch motif family protein n=1 Tax=Reticulomyxa filosa TaxID=46433 RepID=X6NJR3_RETFI|nr:hypothetical protein RFI_11541 [Reticulomyxa filosa]|eukprot:ETO25597.1 hypothetical protein RFI_11541 [Reticulomyxa filosa]
MTSFQTLPSLPMSLHNTQCVAYKREILVCGGHDKKKCYSYHTIKNQYKEICSYPNDVKLQGHCVVKRVDENNPNEITLLSFGGSENKKKHTLVMKYVSVWEEDPNNIEKIKQANQWNPFTNNDNQPILIGRDKDYHRGVRAVIGGSNNHLLFITYSPKNIDVFNLNTFQYIKHDTLPTSDFIFLHCFVLKTMNGLERVKTNIKKNEILLFCKKTGLSIEYDEDNNTFQFHRLPVCNAIALFYCYAYVYINDFILFFGGWNGNLLSNKIISKSVHKYSIKEKTWITFEHTLPISLKDCFGILNEDNTYIHIIGGSSDKDIVSTHMKTNVIGWMDEKEIVEVIRKERKEDDGIGIKSLESNDKNMNVGNDNEESKEEEKEKEIIAYVIINEKKKTIKMKELTFKELMIQCYNNLEEEDFEKMTKEKLKMEIIDIKNGKIIESNEDIIKILKDNEPLFKINWISFKIESELNKKIIKNGLVIMININEYDDDNNNISNDYINNYRILFEKKLNYTLIYNEKLKMNKEDIKEYLIEIIINKKLRKNIYKYDCLIIIISGYINYQKNILITSNGNFISIYDHIFSLFQSFQYFPKLYIIDCCYIDNYVINIPNNIRIKKQQQQLNNDFVIVWSILKKIN